MRSFTAGLALAVIVAGGAQAAAPDNSSASEVVVTASRLTEYDPTRTPQVTLLQRADNLVTEVRVVCDTREPSQRRAELRTTLRSMIQSAAADPNIELGVGEEIVGRFDDSMLDTVIRPDAKADTSFALVVVKTHVSKADTFDAATGRITRFIERTPKAGRTEILREGDWELTLVGPQQYRAAVIALVAEDSRRVAAAFGAGYGATVSGLQLPVSWYQAGPLDLALYIPYRLDVAPLPAEHR